MTRHVLFVDDEPNILQGLRRMLRPLRHEWEMTFASDGDEALGILAKVPCDVLVSDMRMPGMSGTQLIEQVRERHPEVVRIILTGQADRDSTVAAVGCAHQYLSKPCDSETLKATVDRALQLRERISTESIASVVSQVRTLPAVPQLYLDLKDALASDDSTAETVAEIVASDPAMVAKVLQITNSAFFGLRRQIDDATDAVRLLGFDLVHSLTLSAGVFSPNSDRALGPLTDQLWRHSVLTASFAKLIVRAEKADTATFNAAMTAALIHDVGKLVLAASAPTEYLALLCDASNQPEPVWELETDTFGTSHAEVGGYLLGLWALPEPIAEIVAYHHCPADMPATGLTALAAVHVADGLAHHLTDGGDAERPTRIDWDYLQASGLGDRYERWEQACREAVGG